MNILITGASGFVGQHLLKMFDKTNHNVVAIARKEISIHDSIRTLTCDFSTLNKINDELIEFQPEVILHLAWQGIPDFSFNMSNKNLSDSINFFDWIFDKTKCKKIIISGSCFEYGRERGACNEFDPVNINSYFAWAKHSLNNYLSLRCAEKDIILNWFRIFYIYGPGQREGSLIPSLIRSISAKETPVINTPMNKNDFIYVEDVVKIIAKAIETNLISGIYNLGSGYSTSVYDICRTVEKQLLNDDTISTKVLDNGQQTETVNFWADMKKTKDALNISVDTSLEESINKQIKSIML